MVLSGATALYIGNTSYSKAYVGDIQVWPTVVPPTPYEEQYLTFEASGYCKFVMSGDCASAQTVEYRVNGGTWNTMQVYGATSEDAIELSAGDKVEWKATNNIYSDLTASTGFKNVLGYSADRLNIYGNIMSLFYGDNFSNKTEMLSPLDHMFAGFGLIANAENLVLPATTLAENCYSGMFRGCRLLTTAPSLPATTLAEYCYLGMFSYCSRLTTAPLLPAITLAKNCYSGMFNYCSRLTTAPSLPATTLAENCYSGMFWGCTSLTSAPILPATTLQKGCYSSMFMDCSNLSSVKCLATDISAYHAYWIWLQNASATGTFTKAAGVSWPLSNTGDGIPNNWTVIEE